MCLLRKLIISRLKETGEDVELNLDAGSSPLGTRLASIGVKRGSPLRTEPGWLKSFSPSIKIAINGAASLSRILFIKLIVSCFFPLHLGSILGPFCQGFSYTGEGCFKKSP